MTFPYKVTVTSNGNDINVVVDPPPITTKPEHDEHVAKLVSAVIMQQGIKNNLMGRARLKSQLTSVLKQLHEERRITPKKEKDEGNF